MTANGYAQLRADGSWVPPDWVAITATGPDAVTYLQGQLSQDVAGLTVGDSAWSLLLDPSGKLGFWMRVTRTADDSFSLVVDPAAADGVLARLNRFKLRTDAEISGPVEASSGGPGDEADRIAAGVPRVGAELVDDVIPAELGQWLIDGAVSFTKGCYTGQELVARIDSRGGNVPRHLRGLVIAGDVVPPVGAELVLGDKVVGSVTSVATAATGRPIALAFVHRTVEPAAPVAVRWVDGSATAEVRDLPLDLED